jgi:hypothetical protein
MVRMESPLIANTRIARLSGALSSWGIAATAVRV